MAQENDLNERLKKIVGSEGIRGDLKILSGYFRESLAESQLRVAFPESVKEVQEIVRLADEMKASIYTLNDTYLPQDVAARDGILLDFKKMNKIERVDKRNLMAHVQRGVTFAQLQKELTKEGLKVTTPAAATSPFVVTNLVNRVVIKAAARYPEVPVTNMYVVLADGRLHKSGSHALSEEMSDTKSEGGADISKWYQASGDIFGIITRASIHIYPERERRSALVFGFDDLKGACQALRDIPRREIGTEYLAMDAKYLGALAEIKKGIKLPPWTVLVGFEGREEHIIYQEKMVREFAEELGGKANDSLREILTGKIDEAWPLKTQNHTAFYTLFNRVADFDESIADALKKRGYPSTEFGRLIVSVDRGRAAYSLYALFKNGNDPSQLVDELNEMLLDKGAFYDRPLGKFAQSVFSRIDGYPEHLKRIKGIMDPKGILNPGMLNLQ